MANFRNSPRDIVARKLIETCAAELLALNDGHRIPVAWKQHLLRSLSPKLRKVGRKVDLNVYQKIVKDLVLLGDEARTQRTKHNNPAHHRREIAKRHGVSEKTVSRLDLECRGLRDLDKLDPEKRSAKIAVLADVISSRLSQKD